MTVLLRGIGDLGIFFKGVIAFYIYIQNQVSFEKYKISPCVPGKAIYLPRLDWEICSFFLCMCIDAFSCMLSWQWMKTLTHSLIGRIASHSWVPAPSTLHTASLVLEVQRVEQLGKWGQQLSCTAKGEGTLVLYLVIWRGWQDRAHFHILNLHKRKEFWKVIWK